MNTESVLLQQPKNAEELAQLLRQHHLAPDTQMRINDVIKLEFESQTIYIIDGQFRPGPKKKGLWHDTIGIVIQYQASNFPKFILTYRALIKFFGKNFWVNRNESLRRVDAELLPPWLTSRYSLYLSPQHSLEALLPIFEGETTEHLQEVLINTTHVHRVCANQNFISYYIVGKLNAHPMTQYDAMKSKADILAKAFPPLTS